MSVVVVSWNLNHWQTVDEKRREAWDYLADELSADVALVQEAGPPPPGWRVVGADRTDRHRAWTAAVVSPLHELNEVTEVRPVGAPEMQPMRKSVPGAAATVTVTVDGLDLTLTSLYGLMENGQAYSALNHHLADIGPLLDAPDHFRKMVVGGDLNLTTQWSGQQSAYAAIDGSILAQFRAWGLRDLLAERVASGPLEGCPCIEGENCRHVETWFPAEKNWPHQNDYMFAAKALPNPTSVRVDVAPVRLGLSDHAALVMEMG